MSPLNTIGCILLALSAVAAIAAFARGEWDIKRTNDALNDVSDRGADWGGEKPFHGDWN